MAKLSQHQRLKLYEQLKKLREELRTLWAAAPGDFDRDKAAALVQKMEHILNKIFAD